MEKAGYADGMKTAVSIPDDIYRTAQRLALRTRKSRSRLFSDALREYLPRHAPDEVTAAVDRACAEGGTSAGPVRFCRRPRHPEGKRVVISQGDIWRAELSRSHRVRSGIPRAGGGCSGWQLKPEPDWHGRLHSPQQQPQVGLGSRKRPAGAHWTSLPRDSVANVSPLINIDQQMLTARAEKIPRSQLELVLAGIDTALGRS